LRVYVIVGHWGMLNVCSYNVSEKA